MHRGFDLIDPFESLLITVSDGKVTRGQVLGIVIQRVMVRPGRRLNGHGRNNTEAYSSSVNSHCYTRCQSSEWARISNLGRFQRMAFEVDMSRPAENS